MNAQFRMPPHVFVVIVLCCLGLPHTARGQSIKSCPELTSDIHKAFDCIEGIFSEPPVHLTFSSIPPTNGFPLGVVYEQVTHDVTTSGARSVTDARAALVGSTNGSWYVTGGFAWLPPLPYQNSRHTDGSACHRLGSICTKEVLSLELYASYRRIQSLSFYGLGSSATATKYLFKEDESYGGGVVRLPLWDWLRVEGQVENRRPSLRSSTDPLSVNLNFTETSAPGLSTQPDFMHYSTAARTAAKYIAERASSPTATASASGEPLMKARLTYQFQNSGSYHWFSDLDSGRYSFRQFVFNGDESVQFGSVLQRFAEPNSSKALFFCDGNKKTDTCNFGTIDVKTLIVLSQTTAGHVVPFYYQPTLGGSDIESRQTLRGYDDYRFRAPDAALVQVEYGRTVFDPLGAFVFYDAGKVGSSWHDLSSSNLKQDVGIGLSVRLQGKMVLHAFLATGHGARFGYSFEKFF